MKKTQNNNSGKKNKKNPLCDILQEALTRQKRAELTTVYSQERSLIHVVLHIGGLPVQGCYGNYLTTGPVDGQPQRGVVQLCVPEQQQ